jgi:hypothetical protein
VRGELGLGQRALLEAVDRERRQRSRSAISPSSVIMMAR